MKDTNAAALKTLIHPCRAWLLSMETSADASSVTPFDTGTDVEVAVFVPLYKMT